MQTKDSLTIRSGGNGVTRLATSRRPVADPVSGAPDKDPFHITRRDLPWLARAASDASVEAQRWHLRLIGLDLALLVAAALCAAPDWSSDTAKNGAAAAAAIFMALSLVVTGIIQRERNERAWYDGRAVAESAKTIAWRYITCAEPYQRTRDPAGVDLELIADLAAILDSRKEFTRLIVGDGTEAAISDKMRQARTLDTDARRQIYLRDRIASQEKFYGQNAIANRHRERQWFYAIVGAQVFGLTTAIGAAFWVDSPLGLAGLFATLSAAGFAWIQLKQHKELAQAYGLAAQDLSLIRAKAAFVKTEADLSAYVGDAENAISREHTMWIARRDHS